MKPGMLRTALSTCSEGPETGQLILCSWREMKAGRASEQAAAWDLVRTTRHGTTRLPRQRLPWRLASRCRRTRNHVEIHDIHPSPPPPSDGRKRKYPLISGGGQKARLREHSASAVGVGGGRWRPRSGEAEGRTPHLEVCPGNLCSRPPDARYRSRTSPGKKMGQCGVVRSCCEIPHSKMGQRLPQGPQKPRACTHA